MVTSIVFACFLVWVFAAIKIGSQHRYRKCYGIDWGSAGDSSFMATVDAANKKILSVYKIAPQDLTEIQQEWKKQSRGAVMRWMNDWEPGDLPAPRNDVAPDPEPYRVDLVVADMHKPMKVIDNPYTVVVGPPVIESLSEEDLQDYHVYDPDDDPGYDEWYQEAGKNCHCCGTCHPEVCAGVLQGAPCDMMCSCDDVDDEFMDDDDDEQ